ncbi:hypothetical protein DPEC_G00214950 [Dallia pectoralis]|uniref:Uncharacterized protein n=1 Tax=Dallia pectoralis TaxID=75939 RepID=A0ACC2G2E9_DALPE|nr:hypothetical protein DPEC_G00214950 [Dallia pectoralis]
MVPTQHVSELANQRAGGFVPAFREPPLVPVLITRSTSAQWGSWDATRDSQWDIQIKSSLHTVVPRDEQTPQAAPHQQAQPNSRRRSTSCSREQRGETQHAHTPVPPATRNPDHSFYS